MLIKCEMIVNVGDIIYDHNNAILGKCCHKTNNNREFNICLENGPYIIWIKGSCFKKNKKLIFADGEQLVYFKDK